MNACKVLELATNNDITQLIELARQEITENTVKENHGINDLKRFKLILKYLKRNEKEIFYNPKYSKVWIEENYQCFSNGYTGFLIKKHFKELLIDKDINLNLLEFVPKNTSDYIEITLNISDIKAKIKMHKALKTKQPCTYDINKSRYNAKYILDCYEILGGENIVFKQPLNGELTPSILENENGIAILLPCRKPNVEGEKVS